MTADEIDTLLGSDDRLEPSSGFARSVMDEVRHRAAEPLPLRFPWGRFAMGLAACGVAAASGAVLLTRNAAAVVALFAPLAGIGSAIGWVVLGLAIAFGATRLPRMLARL